MNKKTSDILSSDLTKPKVIEIIDTGTGIGKVIKKSKTYDSFQIVRHVGTPKRGQLPDGTWVEGQDKFWIPEMSGFIHCVEMDDHFLYKIPDEVMDLYPGPIYRCSCGSQAIYVGKSGYVWGASPQGLLFVCQMHITTGLHATGGSRWV